MTLPFLMMMMVATTTSCGIGSGTSATAPKPRNLRSGSPTSWIDLDQWEIGAHVKGAQPSPVLVAVGYVRPGSPTNPRQLLQHDLILRNLGEDPVHFAAGRGCGYGVSSQNRRVDDGACALYLDQFTIPPQSSASRPVTLFKRLAVFAALTEGAYVLRMQLRFRVGVGPWQTRTLEIVYRVGRSPKR